MLFNSYAFVLFFLPAVLVGFFAIGRFSRDGAALWLALASLFFYAWWDPRYLVLLLISIAVNFAMGRWIADARARAPGGAKALLIAALATDLAILGYYKYCDFFITAVNDIGDAGWTLRHVILPLGISFFTFTQIAYLVDVYRGLVREQNPVHYLLFASYFPHLIAGPILHHKQMMPQFREAATYRPDVANFNDGMTIFVLGLFKKLMLADRFAQFANPVFDAAAGGGRVDSMETWVGAIAYTLQLYFDFSAYSDMAIGLSKMFNVDLPVNFNSPYKSLDIIEFWRRWHMTLSTFLRDYLYIPLGGNRQGATRRYLNLLLTMLLGGLWHGANWTFVVWGALHGTYLVVDHGWRTLRRAAALPALPKLAAGTLTFVSVVVAWIVFRAANIAVALRLLGAAFGLSGTDVRALAPHIAERPAIILVTLAAGLALVFVAPNTLEIAARLRAWPQRGGALGFAVGVAFVTVVLDFDKVSTFIYFNF